MVVQDGVGSRALRLLAAVLLLGGLAAGPVVHLTTASERSAAWSEAGGSEQAPSRDDHHDCPICITLSVAAAAVMPASPADHLVDVLPLECAAAAVLDRAPSDGARARAPPFA